MASQQFTHQDLVACPRPQPGIPSPDGSRLLSVVDQWHPCSDIMIRTVYLVRPPQSSEIELNDQDQKGGSIRIETLTASNSSIRLFACPAGEAQSLFWLDDNSFGYISNQTVFYVSLPSTALMSCPSSGESPGTLSDQRESSIDLKLGAKALFSFPEGIGANILTFDPVNGLLAFRAQVWANEGQGHFENVEEISMKKLVEKGGSGVRYDELFVRFRDRYRVPGKVYTVGLVRLIHDQQQEVWATGEISGKRFWDVLHGTGLYSQVASFSSAHVALSPRHLTIALRPPRLNPALHTRFDIYHFPLRLSALSDYSATDPCPSDGGGGLAKLDRTQSTSNPFSSIDPGRNEPLTGLPINLTSGHGHGEVEYLTCSRDGAKIAWTEREKDVDEASKRNIFVWDTREGNKEQWSNGWDVNPGQIHFSYDCHSLFCVAETQGLVLPFYLQGPGSEPIQLHDEGVCESIAVLDDSLIILGKCTMYQPLHDLLICSTQCNHEAKTETLDDAELVGGGGTSLWSGRLEVDITNWCSTFLEEKLKSVRREEFWFESGDGRRVMGWIVLPSDWEVNRENKRVYPMAFLIHGGPQSAFRDHWNIRWNPLVYAARGYVVLALNPCGSSGYGQQFTDDLKLDFAGQPIRDLANGYRTALTRFPQIDPERTVALGASSGGQIIHYINSCNDRFGFKALVSHAGIFDVNHQAYTTDELWCCQWDEGINPNTDRFKDEQWNAFDSVNKFNTPTLITHGAKDFRVSETHALAAFTALQWRGIPSRLLIFSDEAHKIEKPRNMIQWYDEVWEWLDQWIGRPSS